MREPTIAKPYRYMRADLLNKDYHYDENDSPQVKDIGQLLIDFLDMDFSAYDKERLEILSTLADENKLKFVVIKNKDRYEAMRIRRKGDTSKYGEEVIMRNFFDLNANTPDKQIFVINRLYHALDNLGKCHSYFNIMDRSVLNTTDYNDLLNEKLNLVKLQAMFEPAFAYCIHRKHSGELAQLDPLKRLFIYNRLNSSPFEPFRKMTFDRLGLNSKVFYEPTTEDRFGRTERTESEWVDYVKDKDIALSEYYPIYDIATLLYSEFFLMVKLNMQADKCLNCGKFFALKDLYYSKYCGRPTGEGNRTCRSVGAMKKFRARANNDPIYSTYRRVYNRLHTRRRQNTITEETLTQQKEKIAGLRRNVQEGLISFEDYKTQMESI